MPTYRKIEEFVQSLGAKKRGERYVLDEWDHQIYLSFACKVNPERPENWNTADVFVHQTGRASSDFEYECELKENCDIHHILRIIASLGVSRFSEQTRVAYYAACGEPTRKGPDGDI